MPKVLFKLCPPFDHKIQGLILVEMDWRESGREGGREGQAFTSMDEKCLRLTARRFLCYFSEFGQKFTDLLMKLDTHLVGILHTMHCFHNALSLRWSQLRGKVVYIHVHILHYQACNQTCDTTHVHAIMTIDLEYHILSFQSVRIYF